MPRGVQRVSASPYTHEEETAGGGLLERIAAIRVDAFLFTTGAILAAALALHVLPADAQTLDSITSALSSEASSGAAGILEWIAQNAALETAWLLFIALAIVSVAATDPKG